MSINQGIFDRQLDHAANLRLYEEGVHKSIGKIMDRHSVKMTRLIKNGNYNKIRVLEESVRKEIDSTVADAERFLKREMKNFISGESQQVADSLHSAVGEHYRVRTPNKVELRNLINTMPVIGNKTLDQSLSSMGSTEYGKVRRAIRRGISQSLPTDEIVGNVRKITNVTKSQARTITRTSITSYATRAAMDTYQENDDIITGFEYVATLDTRTTVVCARNDGRIFKMSNPKAPRPPLHWNCRSTTVPVTEPFHEWPHNNRMKNLDKATPGFRASANGQVSASMDYDGWLRRQPQSVQLRHFQFDDLRHRTWLSGDIPLRQFTNPDGVFITHAQLRKFSVDRAYSQVGLGMSPSGHTYISPEMLKPGVRLESISELDLDGLLTDVSLQDTMIMWLSDQRKRNLGLSNYAGSDIKTKKRNAQNSRQQTPDSHPDSFYWDQSQERFMHKSVLLPGHQVYLTELERVRYNAVQKATRGSKKRGKNETDQEWRDKRFEEEGSLGLTDEQVDFIGNTLTPRLSGSNRDSGPLFSINEQTTIIRSITNLFKKHNTGDITTNPEGFLVSQFNKQGALSEIGRAIGNNTGSVRRRIAKLDDEGIYNPVTGEFDDLTDLVSRQVDISREYNEWTLQEDWVDDAIGKVTTTNTLPSGPNRAFIGSSDPVLVAQALRETLEVSARTGLTDRDKLAGILGKKIFESQKKPVQSVFRDTPDVVARNTREHMRVGRQWLVELEPELRRNGWEGSVVDSFGRQLKDINSPDSLAGSGVVTANRTHQYNITNTQVREQLVRNQQLRTIKKLGILERDRIPEIRPDGRYLDGVKVDTLRTRGHFNDVDVEVRKNLEIRDQNEFYIDPVFAEANLKLIGNKGTALRELVRSRGDFETVAVLRYYVQQGHGKKPIFFTHKNHEYDRTQAMGALTPTSGEVWRPFLDGPSRKLGQSGYDEIRHWTGRLLDKEADTYRQYKDVFESHRDELQFIGDLQTALAGGVIRNPRLLKRGVKTHKDAIAKLESNKLLNSIDVESRNEVKRMALEVSRIGKETKYRYDEIIRNKQHKKFINYESKIRLEIDASSQGASLVSTVTRSQNGMRKTNVVSSGSKSRIYDEISKSVVDVIKKETGFDMEWSDLSKLQKNNLMTAFYGSKEHARVDRISVGLAKIMNDPSFNKRVLVVDKDSLKRISGSITKAQNRLRKERDLEGTSDAQKLVLESQIVELETLRTDVKHSIKNGEQLKDSLTDLELIDDPDVRKIIESLMASDSNLVGSETIAKIAKILTAELSKEFPTYRNYFDQQGKAARKYIELANQYSNKPVTSIPARDFLGKEVDIDFTQKTKNKLQYIDTDGVLVTSEYSVTETGVTNLAKVKSGYPVKFIFAQDAALARQLTTEFPDFDSIFDAWYGPAGQTDQLRERARELMVQLYTSDVLKENLNAMRSRLAAFTDDLEEWDLFAEGVLNDFDITDVDQSFIDEILDSEEWYGVSY